MLTTEGRTKLLDDFTSRIQFVQVVFNGDWVDVVAEKSVNTARTTISVSFVIDGKSGDEITAVRMLDSEGTVIQERAIKIVCADSLTGIYVRAVFEIDSLEG